MLFEKRPTVPRIKRISVSHIDPNPAQPRKNFDDRSIAELAQSISQNGLLCPVSVRRCGERFQLIAGERRLHAFKLLNESTIPAIIEEADDRRSAVLALVENLQRSELSFFEEAMAIKQLIELCELTQQQAADKLGISQAAVANKLRNLKLPPEILKQLETASLTERHARALLPLAEDERLRSAVKRVIAEQLTVSQTEKMVAAMMQQNNPPKGARLFIVRDLRIFNHAIENAIDMMKQAGIDAVSKKTEDEQKITYTVVIPKSAKKQTAKRCQAAAPTPL